MTTRRRLGHVLLVFLAGFIASATTTTAAAGVGGGATYKFERAVPICVYDGDPSTTAAGFAGSLAEICAYDASLHPSQPSLRASPRILAAKGLPDDALVVRGGSNTEEVFLSRQHELDTR